MGIVAGVFIGKEIYEFLNLNYPNYVSNEDITGIFGIKVSPALLLGYIGQRVGGCIGIGYYLRKRKN